MMASAFGVSNDDRRSSVVLIGSVFRASNPRCFEINNAASISSEPVWGAKVQLDDGLSPYPCDWVARCPMVGD